MSSDVPTAHGKLDARADRTMFVEHGRGRRGVSAGGARAS
jgi:hypothetical protein